MSAYMFQIFINKKKIISFTKKKLNISSGQIEIENIFITFDLIEHLSSQIRNYYFIFYLDEWDAVLY